MAKYRNKPREIVAITFDEFVKFGMANSNESINGMPKSFTYNDHLVHYVDDKTYLIPTLESGECAQRFSSNDMLIIGLKGEIYPCRIDIFEETYEPV